jgi:SulP family sulfate permease
VNLEKLTRGPFPALQGIVPIERSRFPAELVAGVSLAALAIPEVMGYTAIAGMPVQTGLYTILLPIALYALFGSSRHLIVGADSASAAILAAGLAGMAATASSQYVALAGLTALITAVFLLAARVARLGFFADFLSRSVLIGFLTGVGIQVAMGQLAGMFGVSAGTGTTLEKFWNSLKAIFEGDASGRTVLISASVIALILFGKYLTRAVPGALIAVVATIAVSYWADLDQHGVAVVGHIPAGLPHFGLPDVSWSDIKPLLTTAFSIFIIILAQSAATSRAYAAKHGDRFSEDVDLDGLALANVGAGLTGTFVVNGSPTKTQMNESVGGQTQIVSLAVAGVVAVVLLFLTKPIQYMPEATLAAVVFLIGVELVDMAGMRKVYRVRKDEFLIAAVTAAVVVVVGVEQAILLAIVLSIIDHLRRSYKPHDTLLAQTQPKRWKWQPFADGGEAAPGLVAYRFAASLYYANANHFAEEVRAIAASEPPPKWLCLEASSIADIDYTGAETLRELHRELSERGVRLVLVDVMQTVRSELDRFGITDLVGSDAYFETADQALEAFAGGDHRT